VIGDGEREVQVGEAIATVHREGPDEGSGHHAIVLFGEPQHVLADRLSLLGAEHEARVYPRTMVRISSCGTHR